MFFQAIPDFSCCSSSSNYLLDLYTAQVHVLSKHLLAHITQIPGRARFLTGEVKGFDTPPLDWTYSFWNNPAVRH